MTSLRILFVAAIAFGAQWFVHRFTPEVPLTEVAAEAATALNDKGGRGSAGPRPSSCK